jgi:hypothetical protein
MNQPDANQVLIRLLVLLSRSFPQYLAFARPWTRGGDERAVETLEHIVHDQDRLKQQIVGYLSDNDVAPRFGEFPMEYTDTHDLDIEFLVKLAVRYQQQDISAIEACADQLRLAPAALPFAQESLGLAKGHLRLLEELTQQPA